VRLGVVHFALDDVDAKAEIFGPPAPILKRSLDWGSEIGD
jgi:hypothetical protein